jgi:hypothetical protein
MISNCATSSTRQLENFRHEEAFPELVSVHPAIAEGDTILDEALPLLHLQALCGLQPCVDILAGAAKTLAEYRGVVSWEGSKKSCEKNNGDDDLGRRRKLRDAPSGSDGERRADNACEDAVVSRPNVRNHEDRGAAFEGDAREQEADSHPIRSGAPSRAPC